MKAEELLMERRILGHVLKLWKRKEARCIRGYGRLQKETRWTIWKGIMRIWAWEQKCAMHGEEGVNTESCIPFLLKSQRQRKRGKQRGGARISTSDLEELAVGIQHRTEESFGPAEAEQLKIPLFAHSQFCTMFNFMTSSNDPRTILKAAITL